MQRDVVWLLSPLFLWGFSVTMYHLLGPQSFSERGHTCHERRLNLFRMIESDEVEGKCHELSGCGTIGQLVQELCMSSP